MNNKPISTVVEAASTVVETVSTVVLAASSIEEIFSIVPEIISTVVEAASTVVEIVSTVVLDASSIEEIFSIVPEIISTVVEAVSTVVETVSTVVLAASSIEEIFSIVPEIISTVVEAVSSIEEIGSIIVFSVSSIEEISFTVVPVAYSIAEQMPLKPENINPIGKTAAFLRFRSHPIPATTFRPRLAGSVVLQFINRLKQVMMMKVLISFDSGSYTDSELLAKAADVISGMTNNSGFSTPSPTPETIETSRAAFLDALAASNSGSHQAVAYKNDKRKELEELLHDLGVYVNQTAKGDEALLLSSGFDLQKKAGPAGPLPAPENIRVQVGESAGSVELSCERVKQAVCYAVQYRNLTEPGETDIVFATKPKFEIDGLTTGHHYAFRILAIGTNPKRTWSNEVSSFVL